MLAPVDVDSLAEPEAHDVNSDVTWLITYRQGFNDGADNLAPARTAYAYERGYDAGAFFRERVSGTRAPLESHFPGWVYDPRNFPKALKAYSYQVLRVSIKLPKFAGGGDRKSAAFKAAAASTQVQSIP